MAALNSYISRTKKAVKTNNLTDLEIIYKEFDNIYFQKIEIWNNTTGYPQSIKRNWEHFYDKLCSAVLFLRDYEARNWFFSDFSKLKLYGFSLPRKAYPEIYKPSGLVLLKR